MSDVNHRHSVTSDWAEFDVLSPARWRVTLRRILVLSDVAAIAVSSFGAYLVRGALGEIGVVGPFANELPVALGVLPLWLAILYSFGCYAPHHLSAGGEAVRRFLAGVVAGVVVLGFISFLARLDLSRLYVAFLFLFVLILGGAFRAVIRAHLRRRRKSGQLTQRVVIVGTDGDARGIATAMRLDKGGGYLPIGFLDQSLPPGTRVVDDLEVVGRPDQIVEVVRDRRAGLAVVSSSSVEPGVLRDITLALEGSPIDLALAPSLFEVVTRRITVESVGNVPLLHVDQVRLTWGKATAKRALDVLVSSMLLVMFLPLMAAAAFAIKLNDRGPILFKQERVGRSGRRFMILKFRTMVPDAESRLVEVEDLNEVGHAFFKIREDPRVTSVGRHLRKWSVDELPQLWNVLRGHMSMVGPRPPLPSEVEQYEEWHLRRLRVKPGVTGIWQVSGRSHVPFDEAVRLDIFYIENWSLGLDLYLLAKTVPAVLGRQGAY